MDKSTRAERTQRPYKRRQYFINKSLQGKFTIYFLMLGLLIAIGSSTLIWHYSSAAFDEYIYRSHLSPISPWDVVLPLMAKSIIISVIALIISTYLLTRLIFRRISSRLMTFNEAMGRIGSGDLKTKVPEGGIDELNSKLDKVRERLREKITALSNIQKEMEGAAKTSSSTENKRSDLERLGKAFQKELSDVPLARMKYPQSPPTH